MTINEQTTHDVGIHVENVGGIDETDVTFSPGVTLLVGRNATNRTSFLQAIMAGFGSERASLKGDADEGAVDMTIGEETYERRLVRDSGGRVRFEGDPYLEDPELADLFAFLLENNEARRTVARGDDLRDLILRPIDTDEIQSRIETLVSERDQLSDEIDGIEELKGELPELERERERLREEIETRREELAETESELESADADVEQTRREKADLDDALDRLRETRSELEDVRYRIETEQESRAALREERAEIETELDEHTRSETGEIPEIEDRIADLRGEKREAEAAADELQSIVGFNADLLDGSSSVPGLGDDDEAGADPTRKLVDEEVTCWTCGSDVSPERIETTLDRLRELGNERMERVRDLREEIDELQERRGELERSRRERERLERRLDDVESEIDETAETIDDLRNRRSELTDDVERIEAEVDDLEDDSRGTVLDLHREANEMEYELGRLETDLEGVEDEIAEVEERLDSLTELRTQREAVVEELTELRTRIDRIEREAVEAFNEHMDTVLELLDYGNLDRIWIERVEQTVREGRRKVERGAFELHVVRTTESGTAYEDTIDHLSESEREVTGLVFALAGYLSHELYETVPVMLLDSLEAIDADRIAALVEYLAGHTDYLVAALLPDDAAALPGEYERITEI
ncbi:archaea-specific SMC-related protein [Halobaculum lipolyticum]|uniref:Archaea-specific SMC-related protein n=1 Tax=Halobaculum lipolyticum TaxID=3032001 RepID=A0ABD5WB11_9EURY|nr:archaea-specific SMC-related protein [Halobaculum sp. DT31]